MQELKLYIKGYTYKEIAYKTDKLENRVKAIIFNQKRSVIKRRKDEK
jgi:hypothetical protein